MMRMLYILKSQLKSGKNRDAKKIKGLSPQRGRVLSIVAQPQFRPDYGSASQPVQVNGESLCFATGNARITRAYQMDEPTNYLILASTGA